MKIRPILEIENNDVSKAKQIERNNCYGLCNLEDNSIVIEPIFEKLEELVPEIWVGNHEGINYVLSSDGKFILKTLENVYAAEYFTYTILVTSKDSLFCPSRIEKYYTLNGTYLGSYNSNCDINFKENSHIIGILKQEEFEKLSKNDTNIDIPTSIVKALKY